MKALKFTFRFRGRGGGGNHPNTKPPVFWYFCFKKFSNITESNTTLFCLIKIFCCFHTQNHIHLNSNMASRHSSCGCVQFFPPEEHLPVATGLVYLIRHLSEKDDSNASKETQPETHSRMENQTSKLQVTHNRSAV